MKRGEHDWLSAIGLPVIKWMDNKSVILPTNRFNSEAIQQINQRAKRSEKMNVSCPSVVHEYNQFMGGVRLCDQIKVTYEVDRCSKFSFRVFFDFLDIVIIIIQ